jgi:hypothetical protein
MKRTSIILITFLALGIGLNSCKPSKSVKQEEAPEVIVCNSQGSGPSFELTMTRGKAHNHPLMAVWLEDSSGNYLQTLYVAKSIATGVFGHGDKSQGHWEPGAIRRPAALPYWSHKRGVRAADGLFTPSPENPVPDAYSGPTPKAGFILKSKADAMLPAVYNVMMEINQPWDWNEHWTNGKYPGDSEYLTSAQPSLIFSARIEKPAPGAEYQLKVIGRGHYSGKDGNLYTDLHTMTTALNIVESVKVRVN